MATGSLAADFPRDIDGLTAEWLTDVLRRDGAVDRGTAVRAFNAILLSDGVGQTGVVARLSLSYDGGQGPASLIAKLATADEGRRKASVVSRLYGREVGFYAQVAPHVDLRAPHAYFTGLDEAGEFFLLLLEDFPNHRPGDQVAGSTRREAEFAMREMARLHAPFWDKPIPVEMPQVGHPPMPMYEKAWAETVRSFGDYMSDAFKALRDPFLASVGALDAWKEASPATLVHGDFKADNLLFADDGNSATLVALDWQAIFRGKAMVDVAYYITHNMGVEDRRSCEQQLIDAYLAELAERGVDYPHDAAVADYRVALAYLLTYAIWICGINVVDHPRAIARKRKLMERISASIDDWRLAEILPFNRA